jgi:hypothetical protein
MVDVSVRFSGLHCHRRLGGSEVLGVKGVYAILMLITAGIPLHCISVLGMARYNQAYCVFAVEDIVLQ